MMIKVARFNFYLLAACGLMLAGGCQLFPHKEEKKAEEPKIEVTTIELHQEVNSDGIKDNSPVAIYRAAPFMVNVDTEPFLDTADVSEASIVDQEGGLFEIRLKFTWRGSALLETITSSNPGKRIAVYCDFGEKRWLAAPVVRGRITDGTLTFTPDATRKEAERIVEGLNKIAKELKKDQKL